MTASLIAGAFLVGIIRVAVLALKLLYVCAVQSPDDPLQRGLGPLS